MIPDNQQVLMYIYGGQQEDRRWNGMKNTG